jgi:hypothetical protein
MELMKTVIAPLVGVIAAVLMGIGTVAVTAQEDEMKVPQPTVPEIFTIKGEFVRIAYNNEGWVTLGYREANKTGVGEDWLMLEVGVTVLRGAGSQTLGRDSFTVKLADGTMVPMATQKEYMEAGHLRALNMRADAIRDSINYFPQGANRACPMAFFSDPTRGGPRLSWDDFEVNQQRACLGRLFFKLPEGKKIETGQYWLNVQFDGSQVQAPFRIMTEEEEKHFRKDWKDIKKEHEAFLKREIEKANQQ